MTSDTHYVGDRSSEQFTRRFDGPDETPTTAIIEAIEEYSGVDATTLPSLTEIVDPDSLNQLLGAPPGRAPGHVVTVSFSYAGYRIWVDSDLVVTLVSEHRA